MLERMINRNAVAAIVSLSSIRWRRELGHFRKSQRDFASKPRVARNELPWVKCPRNLPTPRGLRPKERKICPNHYPWFTFIWSSPPKSVAHFFAIIGFERKARVFGRSL